MEINEMSMEEIETRMGEISALLETEDANVEELRTETDALIERKNNLIEAAAEKRTLLNKIADAKIEPIAKVETEEERKMENTIELRNTPEYINAYANYIRFNDDREVRALLTENGSGEIQVPSLVYDIVKTAWEREGIMALVRKAYLKGNLRVSFEKSADAAVVHTEGQSVTEEELHLGVIQLTPFAIKKWISISDEALDMDAGSYLEYIYDELTYRIAKKAADTVIAKIEACTAAATTGCVAVPVVTAASIGLGTVAQAMANLSDEAQNPVIMMNKLTWGAVKAAQAANGYNYDPFEGLPVVFNNTIAAFSAASTGDTYMIVGDLGHGALANFPNGQEINIKRDDYTLATSDLVRFIGREYVGLGIVANNAFCKVKK